MYLGNVPAMATVKDNGSEDVRNIPADMLLSTLFNAMHRMQYVIQKNGSHIEPEFNVVSKR